VHGVNRSIDRSITAANRVSVPSRPIAMKPGRSMTGRQAAARPRNRYAPPSPHGIAALTAPSHGTASTAAPRTWRRRLPRCPRACTMRFDGRAETDASRACSARSLDLRRSQATGSGYHAACSFPSFANTKPSTSLQPATGLTHLWPPASRCRREHDKRNRNSLGKGRGP
jgi:hypothetical protein